MTWFAFHGYDAGSPIDLAGVQEKDAVALGFHGYATAAQARAHPNSVNFVQAPFVDGFIADYGFAVKSGEQPGGPNADILNPADLAKGNAEYLLNSTGIGGFFHRLEQGSTWLRVAEAILGITLIAVGVAKITDAVPAATKIARALA